MAPTQRLGFLPVIGAAATAAPWIAGGIFGAKWLTAREERKKETALAAQATELAKIREEARLSREETERLAREEYERKAEAKRARIQISVAQRRLGGEAGKVSETARKIERTADHPLLAQDTWLMDRVVADLERWQKDLEDVLVAVGTIDVSVSDAGTLQAELADIQHGERIVGELRAQAEDLLFELEQILKEKQEESVRLKGLVVKQQQLEVAEDLEIRKQQRYAGLLESQRRLQVLGQIEIERAKLEEAKARLARLQRGIS